MEEQMKSCNYDFVQCLLNARAFICTFLFITVFIPAHIYPQLLDTPPYGLSVDDWIQLQESAESNLYTDFDNNIDGGVFTNGGFDDRMILRPSSGTDSPNG